jgi:hypothetical protein
LEWLARFIGEDSLGAVDRVGLTLGAPWAQEHAPAVGSGCLGLLLLAVAYYQRFQTRGSLAARTCLGLLRGSLLAMLLITLATPILRVTWTNVLPPTLFVVLDGTDSMGIEDNWPEDQRERWDEAVGGSGAAARSRAAAFPGRLPAGLVEP